MKQQEVLNKINKNEKINNVLSIYEKERTFHFVFNKKNELEKISIFNYNYLENFNFILEKNMKKDNKNGFKNVVFGTDKEMIEFFERVFPEMVKKEEENE